MFMADKDEICPMAQNEETRKMLGNVTAYKTYRIDSNLEMFTYNGDDMVNDMKNFLDDSAPATYLQ